MVRFSSLSSPTPLIGAGGAARAAPERAMVNSIRVRMTLSLRARGDAADRDRRAHFAGPGDERGEPRIDVRVGHAGELVERGKERARQRLRLVRLHRIGQLRAVYFEVRPD